ncbi:Tropinone reductase-like 3, partial [Bienertia sinuspersici]
MEKISKRFTGKVAIVTASTQGIGFSIAERLGLEGASVVICSRKQKNVDESVEKLKKKGIEVLGVVCHVSNAQQRKNLIDQTVKTYGKIDVVVSNAAANPSVELILDTAESVLDKLWEINVKASILLLKALAAEMAPNTRVNCVAPGFVPTQDMAAATAFLASDDAAYITGETLVVAGGMPS